MESARSFPKTVLGMKGISKMEFKGIALSRRSGRDQKIKMLIFLTF
jgi:hypothetical protein